MLQPRAPIFDVPWSLVQNADFERRLAATIAWSQVRMATAQHTTSVDALFRTPMRPGGARRAGPLELFYESRSSAVYQDEVRAVVDERIGRLAADGVDIPLPQHATLADMLGGGEGRLFGYLPNMNLCDGASGAASDGWFDVDNVPPWDLWVDVVQWRDDPILLSWTPRRYVELARSGVRVNPEECIAFVMLVGP